MQTHFQPQRLSDPYIAEADKILRTCVHCGFCLATCPTYVELGDENDSPRGRIYLMKRMLETDAPASPAVAKHLDRCLSCLSCMTTCPSGVDYMHLVDHSRARVEATYRRPLPERMLRALVATVLPRPGLLRASLLGARVARPFAGLLPGRLKGMVGLAPRRAPEAPMKPGVWPAEGERRMRVALMPGCVQQVIGAEINRATIRLLTRLGCEVVVTDWSGCCGALTHHMGREKDALARARRNVAAWTAEKERGGLDAIVINASGCGTTIKDYGHMLRTDPAWAERAATVATMARDVSEVLTDLAPPATEAGRGVAVAYHSACSLQHGQRVRGEPVRLLEQAGFEVRAVPEGHLCCGSAGTYNLMQPELATRLQKRKAANIEATGAAVVATGNIGCIVQIGAATALPVVHMVQLLDWATGGPRPEGV